jgi:SAM-dependent methyltransferase
MHRTSYDNMALFVEKHLSPLKGRPLRILDVGSQDVNGTYKPLFSDQAWRYSGADVGPGPNVDVILKRPYLWRELKANSYDVVVSGQTLEHIEYPWLTVMEIARIMRPGGICCLIAPSVGPEHRYPLDCWRLLPDGARALARYASLQVIETYTCSDELDSAGGPNEWYDTVLIATKPMGSRVGLAMFDVRRFASLLSLPRG